MKFFPREIFGRAGCQNNQSTGRESSQEAQLLGSIVDTVAMKCSFPQWKVEEAKTCFITIVKNLMISLFKEKLFFLYSAANRSENSDFVQNSDQMLQMVRKWSEN